MVKPNKKSKNKILTRLLILALIIIFPFIVIFVFVFIKTWFSTDKEAETEIIQEEPKPGDTLLGISHEEIVNEYKKQSSEQEATNYLDSLSEEEIIWIGLCMDIRSDWVNGKQYMVVSFTEDIIDTNLGYINVDQNTEYQKISDMTLIKISGSIDHIEPFLKSGINVYFEEATIEIVEQ